MTTTTAIEDLWPRDFGTSNVTPPITILKQQATVLGQRMQNILQGEVSSEQVDDDTIYYNFYIVSSALGNYRYKLFWVSQHIDALYPVWMSGSEQPIEDEAALRTALMDIFGAEKTRKVVQSLMASSGLSFSADIG